MPAALDAPFLSPSISVQATRMHWRRCSARSVFAAAACPESTPTVSSTAHVAEACSMVRRLSPGVPGRCPAPNVSLPPPLFLQATAKGALKAVPVAVSGAFHTELMQPARDALTEASTSQFWLA